MFLFGKVNIGNSMLYSLFYLHFHSFLKCLLLEEYSESIVKPDDAEYGIPRSTGTEGVISTAVAGTEEDFLASAN